MKAFFGKYIFGLESLRKHGKSFLITLVVLQSFVILIQYTGNNAIRELYSISAQDNVKLIMELMKLQEAGCDVPPDADDEGEPARPQTSNKLQEI